MISPHSQQINKFIYWALGQLSHRLQKNVNVVDAITLQKHIPMRFFQAKIDLISAAAIEGQGLSCCSANHDDDAQSDMPCATEVIVTPSASAEGKATCLLPAFNSRLPG